MTEDASGDPAPGTVVLLVSQAEDEAHPAHVISWRSLDAGLVVAATLEVAPEVARRLADHRVWVSLGEQRGVSVFGGVAHPVSATALLVTGVVPVVRETRRRQPRLGAATAPVSVTIRLRAGGAVRRLRAADLSRDAVRVEVSGEIGLAAGDHVGFEVELGPGEVVAGDGTVIRVDGRHAVVHFDDLAAGDGQRIERHVLLRLAQRPDPPRLPPP